MSRAPDKECVEKLRAMLADHRFIGKRITELRKLLAELPKLEEEFGSNHRLITKTLEEMDLKQSGNSGWEGRIVWFLNELDQQARADPG